MGKQTKKKVSFFKKTSVKLTAIVALASLLAAVICLIITVPSSSDTVSEITQNEIQSLVTAYSTQIETALSQNDNKLDYEKYSGILKDVKIQGVESSYAYLVDGTGMMQYHPTQEKVGKPVENSVVKGLVSQIQAGQTPAPATVSYDFKGTIKYAGYQILSDKSIFLITADEEEILASVSQFKTIGIVAAIVITVAFAIIGFFVVTFMVNPILRLANVIDETASLDFADDSEVKKIAKRGDEVGVMAKAVVDMRDQLRNMVREIQSVSEEILKDISQVNEVSLKIQEECTENSATTEQLAAGMEETSSTTSTIKSNIDAMQEGAEDIRGLSDSGVKLSEEITQRAISLRESTNEATKRTTNMYETIKTQANEAMNAAECVQQINEMTSSIMQISSQTSLLALNASIEAARAGEAGKGFAVVASEISKLANETSDSVTSINGIVDQVNTSVAEMVKSMENTTQFLEDVVLKDYDQFKSVSDQYNDDASVFKDSMQNVEKSVVSLMNSITAIADAISGINSTVDDASSGVSNIADKTSNVVMETSQNAEYVDACMDSVGSLDSITKKFRV